MQEERALEEIRVAYVIDSISSPTAGTEKQLLLLLKHLSTESIHPYLCCLHSSPWLDSEFKDFPLVDLKIGSFRDAGTFSRLRQFSNFLRSSRIQIVQTHFRDANYFGTLAARMAGLPIISTRRGDPYWRNVMELQILRMFDMATDKFIANSRASANYYCSHERIPSHKMNVIHNGLNLSDYPDDDEYRKRHRARLGIDAHSHVVGIVANLRPVKAIDVFLRAAALVAKRLRDVRFIVVGDGPCRQELTEMLGPLEIASQVTFLGKRQDIPDILAAFDVGVLSSHSESFSNSIIEYQAAGLPVVCTDVGGAREAVEDGVTGFLVPPNAPEAMANRILQLLDSNSSRKQFGLRGREHVTKFFSIRSSAKQYAKLYARIKDERRSRLKSTRG